MGYEIRTVRADDWAELKELRLAALRDPVARVAFVDTYENSVTRADDHWRAWATPIAEGGTATNVIAKDGHGRWVAMLALLDETGQTAPPVGAPGVIDDDSAGSPQIHVVSVYVRPEHRGTGVAEQLFRTAIDWTWQHTKAERIHLWVHADNPRAEAFYRRLGFTRTGETMPFPPSPEDLEYEMAMERPATPMALTPPGSDAASGPALAPRNGGAPA
ncbi:GNAT family N-acetyltransferase [Streptomyces sp. KR80]|uniref:GNAT family N-acetyltransferase n=1 Tax=Streptomyces sp. KR80 TaxID=3457426 RepID=UPI003FD0E4BB